jgi:peptide-methionine (R)-S-oxide reductase
MRLLKAVPPSLFGWQDVLALAAHGNAVPPRRVRKSDAEWRALLTYEQYRVTRLRDERSFSSELCGLFEPGRYRCACCDTPLFDTRATWPSFSEPLSPNAVAYHPDTRYGLHRIETRCNVCDAHLGHVFPEGPPPSGLVYCVHAASLRKA